MSAFDISRINFDPAKHYKSVRMQQGRVLTDDDWNENERIENEDIRKTRIDIIGPYGSPDDGFKISPVTGFTNLTQKDRIEFLIDAGTLYLGGLRVELEHAEHFHLQKDWLQQPIETIKPGKIPRFDLAYIEVWQQGVSAVEDSSLFEVALGGVDTTTRVRTMRRVLLAKDVGADNCQEAWARTARQLGVNQNYEQTTDSKLKVTFNTTGLPQDLCTPSVAGGYLGAENQAIRVQIVDHGHFVWGFDNASPLYKVTVAANGALVTMLTDPKDQCHWPLAGQIVEILPWSAVLSNGEKVAEQSGFLTKVSASFNPDTDQLTLRDALPAGFGIQWHHRTDRKDLEKQDPANYFYMRVWNRGDDLSSEPAIAIQPAPVTLGNTGLAISISGKKHKVADYWVIAARPETPNRVVPWKLESSYGALPNGTQRFFAPLGIIGWSVINDKLTGSILSDCRIPFKPLTERQGTCITVSPGTGWERVFSQFKTGQDICICFKNGLYELTEPVVLENMGNVKFTGCGKGSQVVVHNRESAFVFRTCKDVLIRDLSIGNDIVRRVEPIHILNEKVLTDAKAATTTATPQDVIITPQSTTQNLNGVLTVVACQNALFENITVACVNLTDAKIRQNTCVTVYGTAGLPRGEPINQDINIKSILTASQTQITINNSQLSVGNMQTGVLSINTVKTLIDGCTITSPQTGNQGIVVGGTRPNNVTIVDNIISNMIQGIHVGTSYLTRKAPDAITAGTVSISGNNVTCILQTTDKAERHGIFVGNCDSLLIKDNYIKLLKQGVQLRQSAIAKFEGNQVAVNTLVWPATNGIRAFGYFGKRMIIKDNHLEGFDFLVEKKPLHRIISKPPIVNRAAKPTTDKAALRNAKAPVANAADTTKTDPKATAAPVADTAATPDTTKTSTKTADKAVTPPVEVKATDTTAQTPVAPTKETPEDVIISRRLMPNYGIFIHYFNAPEFPRWWVVATNVTAQLRIEGPDKVFRTTKMTYADNWEYFWENRRR